MEIDFDALCKEVVKVVGVGGGGTRAVDYMIDSGLKDVEFIVVDIDVPTFRASQAQKRVQLCGQQQIKRVGIGEELKNGRNLALMSADQLSEYLTGTGLVFVVAGMGGKTGTGAASVIAQLAQKSGALVVGVASKPFDFEGSHRKLIAEFGLAQLVGQVDSLITISSDNLLKNELEKTIESQAFRKLDDVVLQAVYCISALINGQSFCLYDFKEVMKSTGKAVMGIGIASGKNRSVEATKQSIVNLQIEDRNALEARGLILMYNAASQGYYIEETSDACNLFFDEFHEDCDLICGVMCDESLGDKYKVTAIAVNFDSNGSNQPLDVCSTVEEIKRTVAEYYEISTEDLLLKNKSALLHRQIAMYLAWNITGGSYLELENKFRRDHVLQEYMPAIKLKRNLLVTMNCCLMSIS